MSADMVEKAREKGLQAIQADMRSLPFEENEFDGIISISALQWILTGSSKPDILEAVKKVSKEASRVLKPNAKAVYQFYPDSKSKLREVGKVFSKEGMKGEILVDYPENPKKRKVYMCLKNKKEK